MVFAPPARDPLQASTGKELPFRVLLASKSARRRSLLTEQGINHDVISSGMDDSMLRPGKVSPEQWVAALAYLKAWAAASTRTLKPDELLIGADTLCVQDDQLIGQPADAEDARRSILAMQDRDHAVVTGVALITRNWRWIFVDRAEVTVGHIGNARIDDYIDSGLWQGKAGAYNLTERLEAGWPLTFKGDPTTIVGLPMRQLLPLLSTLGVRPQERQP